jgi:miniconductance mechanosensitive channel
MLDQILPWLESWLTDRGVAAGSARTLITMGDIVLVVLIAAATYFVARRIVARQLQRWAKLSSSTWDDYFSQRRVFHRLSHLAPALVLYEFAPLVLERHPRWLTTVQEGSLIYMLAAGAWVIAGILSAIEDVLGETDASRNMPVKSFVQVGKIILFGLTFIAVISVVIDRSPVLLFSGLGAMTAVLLLVFKDPLLGLVGGIQLSANHMVAVGDWIEMPKYGADGDVIDVALTTVKVQNFDKTIVTIPTYSLVSESFKNWRGMAESGGRRIKRAINIDMTSVRFCDQEMLSRFRRIQYVAGYLDEKQAEIDAWNAEQRVDDSSPVNGRRLTNLGTFRAYVVAYLRHHPQVNQEMTFLVRHLDPTPEGLPLEVYVFANDTRWANYESIQADIFDHLLAVVTEFDLRVFQIPSGSDMRAAFGALNRAGAAGGHPGPSGQG